MDHPRPRDGGSPLVKIAVRPNDGSMVAWEHLWARQTGPWSYKLLNIPLNHFGLAYGDVVLAHRGDQGLIFDKAVLRGGHSTYRIYVQAESLGQRFEEYWSPLRKLGCGIESATDRLKSIDIPPEAGIDEAYLHLERGMTDGVWLFDEMHVGHMIDR